MEMSNEEILLASVEEVKQFIKEHNALHTDPVTNKVAKAMELIGYEKGFKKGKSVGSHQAFNHCIRQGHWNANPDYLMRLTCSECGHHVVNKNAKTPNYCENCGARLRGIKQIKDGDQQ